MISINFAGKNYRLAARITKGLTATGIVLLLIAAVLLGKSLALRNDFIVLQKKLYDAAAADEQVRATLLERDQLVKDLNSMSALLSSRKFSWTEMFSQLEAAVPTGVALKSIAFNPKDRSLSLEGAAQTPESLRNLVVGLERSKAFSDPYLKHQSLEKGTIAFNVVAVYQERKSAVTAHRSR
jgi:Tfp pilus assembly protein PilN